MITQIIENSRALLASSPNEKIYFYFDELVSHVSQQYPEAKLPTIKLVYSINKNCETFLYKDVSYIIYDQYLGQAFNKFNRLIFHEEKKEVRAYLSKLIGEEYYLVNDIENCIANLVVHGVSSKATFRSLPKDFLEKKTELILVQESFVLLHELAHNLVKEEPSLISEAKKFVENDKTSKITMAVFLEHFNTSEISPNLDHFYEEFTCDILAAELAYSFWGREPDFSKKNIIEGISLAFLYLRTLIDIKSKVSPKASTSSKVYSLFTHLRYNLMRHYYLSSTKFNLDGEILGSQIDLYEKWEDKIDMEIGTLFDESYNSSLRKTLQTQKQLLNLEMAQKLLKLSN